MKKTFLLLTLFTCSLSYAESGQLWDVSVNNKILSIKHKTEKKEELITNSESSKICINENIPKALGNDLKLSCNNVIFTSIPNGRYPYNFKLDCSKEYQGEIQLRKVNDNYYIGKYYQTIDNQYHLAKLSGVIKLTATKKSC